MKPCAATSRIPPAAQKQAEGDDPKSRDLYTVGTVATILQLLNLLDGTVKVLVEGVARETAPLKHGNRRFLHRRHDAGRRDIEQYEEREIDVLTRSVVSTSSRT